MSTFTEVTNDEKIRVFGSLETWIRRTWNEDADAVLVYIAEKYKIDATTLPFTDVDSDMLSDVTKFRSKLFLKRALGH